VIDKKKEVGTMVQNEEQVTGERLVISLINSPRAKLDLIAFTSRNGTQHDFALRKMIWTGAGGAENARAYEIKLDLDVARALQLALSKECNLIEALHPSGPAAVRSA
jgi:hypothetical protein